MKALAMLISLILVGCTTSPSVVTESTPKGINVAGRTELVTLEDIDQAWLEATVCWEEAMDGSLVTVYVMENVGPHFVPPYEVRVPATVQYIDIRREFSRVVKNQIPVHDERRDRPREQKCWLGGGFSHTDSGGPRPVPKQTKCGEGQYPVFDNDKWEWICRDLPEEPEPPDPPDPCEETPDLDECQEGDGEEGR